MANGVELATAYISLSVETSKVKDQVKSAMNDAASSGKAAGQKLGTEFADALRNKVNNMPWIRKAIENGAKGSGTASARRFFSEFQTTSQRAGAVAGLVIGKTVGLGITAGLKGIELGGAIFTKMEIGARKAAVKIGATMAAAVRSALASTGVGLGVAGIAGAGGVLLSGLDRLKTIQRAEVQLSLKLPPQEIKNVTQKVTEAVQGTPISLDAAMAAAPKAIAQGMNADQVKQYITDIANATASSGGQASFEQLDIIFGQILTKGKLLNEEVMQLTENGVDVRSALKDAFGWDDKTLDKNLAAKKLTMTDLQKAIQKTWGKDGGLAQKMGETFEGATGNLKASIARLGANVLGALFGREGSDDPLANATDGVKSLTEYLDKAGKWVAENRNEIREVFTTAGDAIAAAYNGVKSLVEWFGRAKQTATDIGGSISRAWDNVTSAIGRVGDKAKSVVDTTKTKFTDMVNDVKKVWDGIFGEQGWFAQQFKKIADLIGDVRELLGFGPATANAAGGTTPFNPGPLAPGAFGNYLGRAGMAPGTRLDGSDQGLTAVPGAATAAPAASNTARVPYGLPPGTDTGGYGTGNAKIFPEWVMQVADYFGIKPSTYSGHQQDNRQEAGYAPNPNNENRGIDWVGPVENLQRFADYLASNPGLMEQVIWQNPNTKRKTGIAGGKDVSGSGYYDEGTYASHGGNDPNNIHVHTRQSQSIPLPIPAPASSSGLFGVPPSSGAAPQQQGGDSFWDKVKGWFGYASGGGVFGAGTATSDSIPAWLSNGEHVLTAKDVKAMGGQNAVYAFRNSLHNGGAIPGFAPGGAVDPDQVQQLQNQLADLNNAAIVAQQRWIETQNNTDASPSQRLSAEQGYNQAQRAYQNALADFPIVSQGGTAPDRSVQENLYSTTDALALAQAQLDELNASEADVPASQRTQAEYSVAAAQRAREQAIDVANNGKPGERPDFLNNLLRTQGFTPTGGGGKAGTSSVAQFIGMGGDIVGGLVDTGASLLQTAAQAGIAAGTMGMGAAAGPAASAAASYGIQLGAAQIKRVANYGFEMAGIGADALIAQLFPFGGPPRWMGYDYTQFAPQVGIMGAATTTLEQMGNQAIQNYFKPQGGATIPQLPQPGAPAPAVSAPVPLGDNGQRIVDPRMTQLFDPSQAPAQTPPPPGGFTEQYDWFKNQLFGPGMATGGHVGVYDQGGILGPGDIAVNKSRIPEKVLTQKQWDAMSKLATTKGSDGPLVKIDAIYGMSPEDVANQIEQKQRLAAMRFSGRPYK